MKDFIEEILREEFGDSYIDIYNSSELIKYINLKSGAIDGDSKTRRSLGNIYAIYSILHFYVEDEFYDKKDKYKKFDGFEYTLLWNFCRAQYGGNKLQNHSLNNRCKEEFANKIASDPKKELIIINGSKYMIHIDYIYSQNIDLSKTIIRIIERYIGLIKAKDFKLSTDLEELSKILNLESKKYKLDSLLEEKSEARVFEILSFAILKNHFKNKTIYIGTTRLNVKKEFLTLYKTGRTNANDGGIDFVMKPLGKFFQVTEVDNYDKYLLDVDKIMHFPMTFVVKTNKTKNQIKTDLKNFINEKSGGMKVIKDRYESAIEDIITINELKEWLYKLNNNDVDLLIKDIDIYYKLEMNIDD